MTREKATPEAARAGLRDRLNSAAGTSPAELLVTIAITVMVLSLSVLGLKDTFISTSQMAQTVANDVRLARIAAVTRGAHYRVAFGSDWCRTERLQDNNQDRIWIPDTSVAARHRKMEGGVTLSANTGVSADTAAGAAKVLEFDTRGMVVASAGGTVPTLMTVAITGSSAPGAMNGTSNLYIWPSGQVQLLHSGEVHP